MASKSGQDPSASTEGIEELLDTVDKTLDRLKTLYEQYFLGIQKQAPAYIHSDVERKLRDLMQLQIRNTGMRYRLTSIQAKFAAYNSYWRRTLRQIENGTYVRNLHKIGRAAARSGADIPEEILAAMPKRMREQILKDREAALAAARRHKQLSDDELLELEEPAVIKEGTELRRQIRGAHVVQDDADFDLDAFFKEVEGGDADDKTPEDQPPVMAPPQPQSSPAVRAPAAPSVSGPIPVHVAPPTGPVPMVAAQRATGPVPTVPGAPASAAPGQRATGPMPTVPGATAPGGPGQRATGPVPTVPGQRATGRLPAVPADRATGSIPAMSGAPRAGVAPSQASRPNPIAPGAAAAHGDVPVESMAGPFPRQQTAPGTSAPARTPTGPLPNPSATGPVPRTPTGPLANPNATGPVPRQPTGPVARPPGAPRAAPPVSAQSQPVRPAAKPEAPAAKPPPGMTDADVNALYAKYVKAKESVGEKVGPGGYGKLLNTINQQAPKIMEQYKAKGVDFSVVVKDNQVIIRAKPKT